MKTTVYLRIGDKGPDTSSPHRHAVRAGNVPSQEPLNSGGFVLPTCAFALELDIPDKAFESAARVVATLSVPEEKLTIAAKVVEAADAETS